MNVKNKEKLIVGTIINCNKEINDLSESIVLDSISKDKNNIYRFNMVNLLNEIDEKETTIDDLTSLNESFTVSLPAEQEIKNSRKNYFAYFNKVKNFLDNFEPGVQKVLNESLNIDGKENDVVININTFKEELKKIIQELSLKDDVRNLTSDILKIKLFANKPLFIYGYDINSNIELKKELVSKFNITDEKLLFILFDQSNKQILFLTDDIRTSICYDLKTDKLDYYNIINKDNQELKIDELKIDLKNGPEQLKSITSISYFVLYLNIQKMELKFEDNLYLDQAREDFNKSNQHYGFIKK